MVGIGNRHHALRKVRRMKVDIGAKLPFHVARPHYQYFGRPLKGIDDFLKVGRVLRCVAGTYAAALVMDLHGGIRMANGPAFGFLAIEFEYLRRPVIYPDHCMGMSGHDACSGVVMRSTLTIRKGR